MPPQNNTVETLLSIDNLQQNISEIERLINQYIGLITGFKLARSGLIYHQKKSRFAYTQKNMKKKSKSLPQSLLLYWEAAIKVAEDKINTLKVQKRSLEKELMDLRYKKGMITNVKKMPELQVTEADLEHALLNTLKALSDDEIQTPGLDEISGSPAITGLFSEPVEEGGSDEGDEEVECCLTPNF